MLSGGESWGGLFVWRGGRGLDGKEVGIVTKG